MYSYQNVCSSGPAAQDEEGRNLLKSLQDSYLRAYKVGIMKTIPTKALEVALCSSPLVILLFAFDQLIVCLARLTAYRLKYQGE